MIRVATVGRTPSDELAGAKRSGGAQRADAALELGQRQPGMLLEEPPGFGQPDPPARALEERHANAVLEVAQGLRDGGLRDRQRVRRLADAGEPGHLEEQRTCR